MDKEWTATGCVQAVCCISKGQDANWLSTNAECESTPGRTGRRELRHQPRRVEPSVDARIIPHVQRLAAHIETEAAAPGHRKLGVIHDQFLFALPTHLCQSQAGFPGKQADFPILRIIYYKIINRIRIFDA